jgi:hypothetical protein
MGMEAKLLQVSLPDPEQFVQAPVQSFAASVNTPLKILVGSQTGERASTEDAKEYAQTAMSRNKGYVIPNIHRFLDRLMAFNIVPARDWVLDWVDLTESTSEQKLERAKGMSQINKDSIGTGQAGPVFTADELREVLDMEPQEGEADFADDPDADDEEDTGTPPTTNRKRGRFVVNIGRRG